MEIGPLGQARAHPPERHPGAAPEACPLRPTAASKSATRKWQAAQQAERAYQILVAHRQQKKPATIRGSA